MYITYKQVKLFILAQPQKRQSGSKTIFSA